MRKFFLLGAVCTVLSTSSILAQVLTVNHVKRNSVSNVHMTLTNYGLFGQIPGSQNEGGNFWPRGSTKQYLYGGGIWFGAKKNKPKKVASDADTTNLYAVISYNPINGKSWMAPGRIEELPEADSDSTKKYRLYFSPDFKPDGTPVKSVEGESWPIWDTDGGRRLLYDNYFGNFVLNSANRKSAVFMKGPAFVSDEDVISTFKSSDIFRYELTSVPMARAYGYPLNLQFEQSVYSWKSGNLADVMVFRYKIINKSSDTLRESWFGPVLDADISSAATDTSTNNNDHARYVTEHPQLTLAAQWSEETGKDAGLGYLGLTMLETPALDANKRIRRDKNFFPVSEQMGASTLKLWNQYDNNMVGLDPKTDTSRYEFLSTGVKDNDTSAGDKRMLMAGGPFTFLPGDTAVFAFALVYANPADPGDPSQRGKISDMAELIDKTAAIHDLYSQSLRLSVEEPYISDENFFSIYPQPANGRVTLNLKNISPGKISAEIYSMLGEKISCIYDGEFSSEKNISFTTENIPSGMYYCLLTVGSKKYIAPIIIAR